MRKINRIFVHCTASYQETTTEKTLKAEFKNKGWKYPGYHYVIKTDGNIIVMLDENFTANGVRGYNEHSIHVAWIGGIDATHPKGIDNRTDAQKLALIDLLVKLKERYPDAEILGALMRKRSTRTYRRPSKAWTPAVLTSSTTWA